MLREDYPILDEQRPELPEEKSDHGDTSSSLGIKVSSGHVRCTLSFKDKVAALIVYQSTVADMGSRVPVLTPQPPTMRSRVRGAPASGRRNRQPANRDYAYQTTRK